MPNRRGDTKNQEGNANEEVGDEREDQEDRADKEHQEEEEAHEGNVNHNTICDGCDKAIYGLRHKYWSCSNFDYCSECMKKASKNHPGHRFETLYEAKSRKPRRSNPVRVGGDNRGGRGHGPPDRKTYRPEPKRKVSGFLGSLGLWEAVPNGRPTHGGNSNGKGPPRRGMPPGPRPPVIPSPYDRPTHGGNSNGNRWPLRDMPPGPRPPVIPSPRTTRSDLTREILEETRASHRPQSQKGQLDPGRAGRRNVRRGSGPQDLGGRRNGQRGSTTEEAGDEEGEGRGDDGRDGDQDPNDLAEKYERQTQKIMISPHEPLSVNVRDSEPPPEAADSPSPADFPGGAPQARRRAGVRANEWTAPGRGGGRAGRAGRDRGDAYRGYD